MAATGAAVADVETDTGATATVCGWVAGAVIEMICGGAAAVGTALVIRNSSNKCVHMPELATAAGCGPVIFNSEF